MIEKITADQLIISHIRGKEQPIEGLKIGIDKKFQMGNMSGFHSLAEGVIEHCSSSKITIKVSKYTSTINENGVDRPMAKRNDIVVLKWEGKSQQMNKSSSSSKSEIARVQKVIYDAQALVKKQNYKAAAELLKPEVDKYHDCWACHFVLGQVYHQLHEDEKAIHELTTVINAQADKYPMAYVWRARAYHDVVPHMYQKAINDYQLVTDKYAKDAANKSYLLKQIIAIQDKIKDHDAACKTTKHLIEIEGSTSDNKDHYNHYCLGIKIPKKPHIRFDGFPLEQSEDLQQLSIKISPAEEACFYSEFLDENPEYIAVNQLKKGNRVLISTCKSSSKMGMAVAEIKSVKGEQVILEILFWTNKMNGHPWKTNFAKDKPLTFSW